MTDPLSKLKQPAVRFVVVFFALALGFNLLISLNWVDENVIFPYTKLITNVSSKTLAVLGYEPVHRDTFIHSAKFAVDIRRGCDGVVATILLVSACLAYPAGWKQRLFGTLAGYALISVLNLLRIVVLFGLGHHGRMEMFNFVHTYVAQFIVIAFTMVFWIYWAGRQRPLYQ